MATRKINGVTFTYHPKAEAPTYCDEGQTLESVYGRYSHAKAKAFGECLRMCNKLCGFDFAISSHNSMTFTVMFDFIDAETNEHMRAHITKSYNHLYHV